MSRSWPLLSKTRQPGVTQVRLCACLRLLNGLVRVKVAQERTRHVIALVTRSLLTVSIMDTDIPAAGRKFAPACRSQIAILLCHAFFDSNLFSTHAHTDEYICRLYIPYYISLVATQNQGLSRLKVAKFYLGGFSRKDHECLTAISTRP